MNLKYCAALATACLALFFSCKKEGPKGVPTPVVLETKTLRKTEGADCSKADTLHSNCLELNLSWPEVKDGNEALKKGVAKWANYFLVGLLSPFADDKEPTTAIVEQAIKELVSNHQDFIKDAEGSPMGNWAAESNGNVLLNDGKYLTLEIEAFTYFGGAHGNPLTAVATFNAQTGKRLTWDDLVTDKEALKSLAEKTFRAERTDIFQPTDSDEPYEFTEAFPFALPQNYGLTDEGIYCHYLHYEVGPYAIGNTQFTIPFKELGEHYKSKEK